MSLLSRLTTVRTWVSFLNIRIFNIRGMEPTKFNETLFSSFGDRFLRLGLLTPCSRQSMQKVLRFRSYFKENDLSNGFVKINAHKLHENQNLWHACEIRERAIHLTKCFQELRLAKVNWAIWRLSKILNMETKCKAWRQILQEMGWALDATSSIISWRSFFL